MTRRLVLSYLGVAGFVLLLVVVPFGLTYEGRAEDRLVAAIERDARVLAGLVEEDLEAGDDAAVRAVVEDYTSESAARVVVVDASGLSMVDSAATDAATRDFSTRPEFVRALAGSQASGFRFSDTLDEELAYVAVPITTGGVVTGAVRVTFDAAEMRSQVAENWLRLLLLAALVLVASGSFGWLVARWAINPVESLEKGAERMAAGDLSHRVQVERGPPELRHLAATFNEMAARVESLVETQRGFVADASHQLRTPLTAMRLRIELLQDEVAAAVVPSGGGSAPGPAAPEGLREDLDAVAEELDRMARLVEGLLSTARSGTSTVLEDVDLAAAARSAVERWSAFAAEHRCELVLRAPGSSRARMVRDAAAQILDNLIDNAITFSPEGSRVEVTVEDVGAAGGRVHLTVRDHGPGLPEDQRRRATDRFWRAAGSPPGGTGLGLAIVAELAAASGGGVELREPASGSGLEVEVELVAAT